MVYAQIFKLYVRFMWYHDCTGVSSHDAGLWGIQWFLSCSSTATGHAKKLALLVLCDGD